MPTQVKIMNLAGNFSLDTIEGKVRVSGTLPAIDRFALLDSGALDHVPHLGYKARPKFLDQEKKDQLMEVAAHRPAKLTSSLSQGLKDIWTIASKSVQEWRSPLAVANEIVVKHTEATEKWYDAVKTLANDKLEHMIWDTVQKKIGVQARRRFVVAMQARNERLYGASSEPTMSDPIVDTLRKAGAVLDNPGADAKAVYAAHSTLRRAERYKGLHDIAHGEAVGFPRRQQPAAARQPSPDFSPRV